MMNDTKKLKQLIKVLKKYAETPHCYERYKFYDVYDERDISETVQDAEEYAQIHFARTLLEQIGEEFQYPYPCPKCGTELEDARGGGVKCPNKDCDYWFCY